MTCLLLPPIQTPKAAPSPAEVAAPGTFRIVPQKPFVTPNRVVYEWRVVCDRFYGGTGGGNPTFTVSNIEGFSPEPGYNPTVLTYYVEVDTRPLGDGSMELRVVKGQWSGAADPLFPPDGRPMDEEKRGSSISIGGDGYAEAPAKIFVHSLFKTEATFPLNATVDLAHIERPVEAFGYVIARKGGKDVYRHAVPVDAKERFPKDFMSSPTLDALRRQGCEIIGSYGRSEPREEDVALTVSSVPTKRLFFRGQRLPNKPWPMTNRPFPIVPEALRAALDADPREVGATAMADSTKRTYILHAEPSVRWTEGGFEPGGHARNAKPARE